MHGPGFHGQEGSGSAHRLAADPVTAAAAPSPATHADGQPVQSHSCPICASCSQAQAIGELGSPLPLSPAPTVEPLDPPVRVSSRTLTLPDKPPRA